MGDYPVHVCVHVFTWAAAHARMHALTPSCHAIYTHASRDSMQQKAWQNPSHPILF